ncbi:MAG: phosphotransacetylase family protein [Deltaproteobacteria bacterium]|nr:phosphotransacetylase family protein [Deltaproteobacteria bacterium]
MQNLFVGSTGDRAGHSLITWAIAGKLKEMGLTVGFFKPFGTDPVCIQDRWMDHDAYLLKESLKLREPPEAICPFLVSDEAWKTKAREEIMAHVKTLALEVSSSKDILIIMGSRHIFFDDAACPIPDIELIPEFDADCILIHRYRKVSRTVYSVLSFSSLVKEGMRGLIVNRIPPEEFREISSELVPTLREKGIPVTTALPEDPVLSFRSFRELGDILNGDIIWGKEHLDKPAGGMTVGSADLTGDLSPFKRAYNKIVILEAFFDQETEEKPSSARAVAGILLTGGRKPPDQLVQAATKARLPLLLVREDTFATLEKLDRVTSHLSPEDDKKVRHMTKLMEQDGGFDRLARSLGIFRK